MHHLTSSQRILAHVVIGLVVIGCGSAHQAAVGVDVSGAGMPAASDLQAQVERAVSSCPQAQTGFVVVHGVTSSDRPATDIGFDRSSSVTVDPDFEACVTAALQSVGAAGVPGAFSVVVDLKPSTPNESRVSR